MPKKQSIENQITRKQESLERKRQQLFKQQEAIKKLEEDLKALQVSRYKKWVESFQDELIRLGDTIDIESISVKDVIEYMVEMAPATEKKADAAPAKDVPAKEQKENEAPAKEADKKAIAKAIEDAFVPDDEPSHDNEDKKAASEHKVEDTKGEEDKSSDKKNENQEKDSSNNDEDNFFQRPQVFG